MNNLRASLYELNLRFPDVLNYQENNFEIVKLPGHRICIGLSLH